MAHGCNATAYQILNPGISHWFSARGGAVVGYVTRGSWLLTAGEPVCAPGEFADRSRSVCYVCAAEPMRELPAKSPEHSAITMGAQPVWNPVEWRRIVRSRCSLRAQLSRSLNKGVRIESLAPGEDGDGADKREIRRILLEWLQSFLSRKCFPASSTIVSCWSHAARHESSRFWWHSPVTGRNGFLIEALAGSPRSPNGTSELLIDAAMNRFAEAGCTWATMDLGRACGRHNARQSPLAARSDTRRPRARESVLQFPRPRTISRENASGTPQVGHSPASRPFGRLGSQC